MSVLPERAALLRRRPESEAERPILKMTGISKRFPGVLALENVHLEVGPAEIHALLGENGAGKSTLLKILSGAHPADAGTIELFGRPVAFATPHDAQRAGVVTIYQEFTLAPDMTIAENVFIGREPGSRLFVSWRRLADETRAIIDRIGKGAVSVLSPALITVTGATAQNGIEAFSAEIGDISVTTTANITAERRRRHPHK